MREPHYPTERPKVALTLQLLLLALMLSGCSTSEHADLASYIQTVKARPAGRIAALPEFETYASHSYGSQSLRDPFTPKEQASIENASANHSGLQPDLNRNREALENFPLDALQFIGQLEKEGVRWAIVQAPDDLVYRVQVGNHIGQNFGEVHTINETQIAIREIVADGIGGWIKRDAALALRE